MLTADIQLNEFNRGMNRLVNRCHVEPKRMMKKELGELTKTLVQISPPKNLAKSIRNMKAQVGRKFDTWRNQESNFDSAAGAVGRSGLKYFASNSKFLFAGAADSDMTKAAQETLRNIYYKSKTIQGSQRVVVGFKHPRTQRVAISTKVIATEKQSKDLGNRIAKNFGRLKAGWLGAFKAGKVSIGGQYSPPKWVIEHLANTRGKFINGLDTPNNPNFTLINFAKGVTSKNSQYFVNKALMIRARAMKANAENILRGKYDYKY